MPIFSKMVSGKFYVDAIKPFFDFIAALTLLILLSPLLILVSLVILMDIRRSPIFIQERVGKDERIFHIYKFRSIKNDEDEKSTTRIGRFFRSVSIDELPQLVNVLKGNMSFVGPRPLLVEYLPYYNKRESVRHSVKPGITGWAQVNGRNAIGWGERMEKDVLYSSSVSMSFDLKIILITCFKLMKRDQTPYKDEPTIKFSEYASKRNN